MAVLKHLSSKSSDYGKSLEYLIFQHNEQTQKPVLDANGNKMLRDEYYLDGLNCDPYSFDKECQQLNAQYHKNQRFDEIKSHHYILSFDPRDAEESGLTGERAQALGIEFAKRFFPGHQALVCTHMDGHNGSGNIHVHIVINSLRKLDVEPQPFMERLCDSRAGYKHHQTRDYLTAMQQGIMEITNREHLHQVDLLSPATDKITEREYWKKRREQEKLDVLNDMIIADGMKPRTTKYQTQKQFLRDAITDISSFAKSVDDFKTMLYEKYGITLKISRGRYSYLHPNRDKYITARKLGSHYDKEYLSARFLENEKSESRQIYDPSYDYNADPVSILHIRSDLHLVVDLQTNIKAMQNEAYARKVKISNLKEMARTVCYIQEQGYDTHNDLNLAYTAAADKLADARKALRATQDRIKRLNEQIHYVGQYQAYKATQTQFLQAKNKGHFRKAHIEELEKYDTGVKYIKEHFSGKAPSLKSLKEEKSQLLQLKEAQAGTYRYFKDYQKELHTVCSNVDSILGREISRTKDREKAQELT